MLKISQIVYHPCIQANEEFIKVVEIQFGLFNLPSFSILNFPKKFESTRLNSPLSNKEHDIILHT